MKVLLNDEREFTAKVIGADSKTDVAVIKIEAENLPAATLADSAKLRVGDVVFAIGNPRGGGQAVTRGTVSATGRHVGLLDEVAGYENFIQTDVAINQGDSGGALIDARGRLVGINSAVLSASQGNIGIGFAVPINLASSIMHSLIDTGTVARSYLPDLLASSDKTESNARERNRAIIAAKNLQLPAILRDSKTDELSALVVKIEQTILDLNHESEMAKDHAQQATATNGDPRQIDKLRGLAISYRERIELLKPILTALKEEIANRNR